MSSTGCGPRTRSAPRTGLLTTTMVAILAEREVEVSAIEATAFALGIHEDTGSLGYAGTTIRDAEALAWCMRRGASQEMVAQYLHTPLAGARAGAARRLVAGLEPHEAGGLRGARGRARWPEYVEGVSNLAHKIVDLTDCRALVCLVEMDGRVFWVVRTRVAELDASAVAAALGGGGHSQAASATYRGSLEDARAAVLEALPNAVRRGLTAGEIMSRPARFVSPDDTVAHAMVLCQRHRQSGDARRRSGRARRRGHA